MCFDFFDSGFDIYVFFYDEEVGFFGEFWCIVIDVINFYEYYVLSNFWCWFFIVLSLYDDFILIYCFVVKFLFR